MPSLEIVCIGQEEPSNFSQLPFIVTAEKSLVSHRSPHPLFQSDFDRLRGCIYHVLDGQGPTCYDLLIRDWYDDKGNGSGAEKDVEFRNEYADAMRRMLEKLLESSPVGQILFTTDYQFGPEKAQRFGPISISEFKKLYNARRVRMNAAYLITAS